MSLRIDRYNRLEPRANDRDMENGFAARVHDPLWLLARQWQMGEHQGENASSPVRVDHMVSQSPIEPLEGNPQFDPAIVPAEALVESEIDDWWTMARRIRTGARFESSLAGNPDFTFADPPPPYEAFKGKLDGRAIWRRRDDLRVEFETDAPPADIAEAWNSMRFNYERQFENAESALKVADHHGGPMDWYSADAVGTPPLGEAPAISMNPLIPTPLEYPGAPHSRFWEIEDAAVDIGGYAPDSAHFATMLLVDLIYSHGDDWFLFPVTGKAGHVLTVRKLKVFDSFGRTWVSDIGIGDTGALEHDGLKPPADFSLFACDGLAPHSLVLWPVAESPLESLPLERVQFGVDEHSNLLWALERIIDSRDVQRKPDVVDLTVASQPYPPAIPVSDLSGKRAYDYVPAAGAESRWHPYRLNWDAPTEPSFELWGLADYSLQMPRPMPHPEAEVLKSGTPAGGQQHRISAAVMAGGGLELERRWQLARDMNGNPVLWVQKQRKVLRNPPARTLEFDVMRQRQAEA
jgi:hypothetical protein